MSGVIKVRAERCLACNRCRLACFVEHSLSKTLIGAIAEEPRPWAGVQVRRAGVLAVPTSCRQCEAAVCAAACPTGAMHRDAAGEPVVVEKRLCVGCAACVMVCPYGVPRMAAGMAHILKCDQCVERVRQGEEPACVAACPTGCLTFVPLEARCEGRDAPSGASSILSLMARIEDTRGGRCE